jgi:hypothetical protein
MLFGALTGAERRDIEDQEAAGQFDRTVAEHVRTSVRAGAAP